MSDDKLIHRDDLDMEVVEGIEGKFAEMFPDMKVVFAGDNPDGLPPEIAAQMAAIEAANNESLARGLCGDCGARIPNWDDFDKEGWKPTKGWVWFTDMATGNPMMWQCPECDAKDNADE